MDRSRKERGRKKNPDEAGAAEGVAGDEEEAADEVDEAGEDYLPLIAVLDLAWAA